MNSKLKLGVASIAYDSNLSSSPGKGRDNGVGVAVMLFGNGREDCDSTTVTCSLRDWGNGRPTCSESTLRLCWREGT